MNRIVLPGGRLTSQLGFGCGVLVGGLSHRSSCRLIEMALKLGITHFDVAPAYGMGLAENVLGDVVGNDPRVTITTKVGIPRPVYNARQDLVRLLVRGPLRQFPAFKKWLLRARTQGAADVLPPPFCFNEISIRRALEESLLRLRRERLDVYLLHEPSPEADLIALQPVMQSLKTAGLIAAFGVGSVTPCQAHVDFGDMLQGPWQLPMQLNVPDDQFRAHFSVIRGDDVVSPGLSVARDRLHRAMASKPNDLILVSAGSPARLKSLVQGVA